MEWFLITSLILVFLYILITILIHYGLNKSVKINNRQPSVSILIAARNEEVNLESCLNSIEKLDYPTDKIEVLIINDGSEDKTEAITNSFISRLSHFYLLNIKESRYNLFGKMNALAQGIEKTSGEIILITDADCEVPVNWVTDFVEYFEPDVGMSGGLTLLSKIENKENYFSRLQALDWIYLQAVASGSCQLGLPVSILGNNFAFRRKAYEEVGGFEQLGFSLTEDMILLQAIHNSQKWKVVYPLNNQTKIYSKPVNTISGFYNQRKRWVLGGKTTHLWGYFISLVSLFAHIFLVGLFVAGFWKEGLLMTSIAILSDVSILSRILKRIKRYDLFKMTLLFKLYYIAYTFIFSIVLLSSKKVEWKDIIHRV
jgi:cellulose synthase/poly-beta-1,6-N-acetylglucosamine synthase-like glycosyltransferase